MIAWHSTSVKYLRVIPAFDEHLSPSRERTTMRTVERCLADRGRHKFVANIFHWDQQVARVLASVKDDHLDLGSEMSMAIGGAKKYGGIGTVCRALDVSETAARTVGFVGLSRISISDVRYEPNEDGPLALIIPVADFPWHDDPEVYDLLAFFKDVPNRCWSRLGNARCLGRWHLRDAAWEAAHPIRGDNQDPMIAYQTPLDWLRGNCSGFCCLHEDWLSFETAGVPSIQPANGDVEFGRKLKRLLRQQARLPIIVVPKKVAA